MSYFQKCKFFELIVKQLHFVDILSILDEVEKLKKDEAITSWLKTNTVTTQANSLTSKNILLAFYQSFFNVKLLDKHHKHPEELFNNIVDIDGVTELIRNNKPGVKITQGNNQAYKSLLTAGGDSARKQP